MEARERAVYHSSGRWYIAGNVLGGESEFLWLELLLFVTFFLFLFYLPSDPINYFYILRYKTKNFEYRGISFQMGIEA